MEYYYDDDKTAIAVLISRNYGAGWSTWYTNHDIAFDKRIVEFWMNHNDYEFCHAVDRPASEERKFVTNFLTSCGYPNVYVGGYADIKLAWVPIGKLFRIVEYDGAESIEYCDDQEWICAGKD